MAAGDVQDAWVKACREQTGQSNVYEARGKRYFWEGDNVEHDDGAITGEILLMLPNGKCEKVGTFNIGGDGKIVACPDFLRHAADQGLRGTATVFERHERACQETIRRMPAPLAAVFR